MCTASNIITLPDYQCCDGDCRPDWLFTTMYFQRTQQGSTHSTQHSTTTKSCSMCQPSYRSPRTITNRSVKLCLIIYVLSYPAPHTSRSVKCPTHHTLHDHRQVSEVMSNNIIMSCPTLHPLPIDQWSVLPITLLTITNGSVSHQQVRRYVLLFCPALHISQSPTGCWYPVFLTLHLLVINKLEGMFHYFVLSITPQIKNHQQVHEVMSSSPYITPVSHC